MHAIFLHLKFQLQIPNCHSSCMDENEYAFLKSCRSFCDKIVLIYPLSSVIIINIMIVIMCLWGVKHTKKNHTCQDKRCFIYKHSDSAVQWKMFCQKQRLCVGETMNPRRKASSHRFTMNHGASFCNIMTLMGMRGKT
jgi:hypothetical protein